MVMPLVQTLCDKSWRGSTTLAPRCRSSRQGSRTSGQTVWSASSRDAARSSRLFPCFLRRQRFCPHVALAAPKKSTPTCVVLHRRTGIHASLSLQSRGVEIRFDSKVEEVVIRDAKVTGVRMAGADPGDTIATDHVSRALNPPPLPPVSCCLSFRCYCD